MGSVRRRSFILLMAVIAPACLGGGGSNNKPPATVASAPTTLAAPSATTARIDLTWIDTADNEFEFRIERSDDGGATYQNVGTAPKNVQGFTDLGLLANTTYFYRVAAWNAKGLSTYAGPVSKSTLGLSWTSGSMTGGPSSGLGNHSAIYDAIGTRMIVFGGWDDTLTVYGDVWSFDLTSLVLPGTPWGLATVTGTAPLRFGHSAVYDSANRRMIVFGGQDDGFVLRNEVFILNLATMAWSQPSVTGTPPTPRSFHTAVYDSAHQQMIVHGGNDGVFELDDTYVLSLPTAGTPAWSSPPIGARPVGRSQHASIFDPLGSRLVFFGGFDQEALIDGSSLSNESWSYDPAPPTWGKFFFGGTPGFTMSHSAAYDAANQRMVVFGGAVSTTPTLTNAMWGLKLGATPSWVILSPTSGSPPVERMSHSAVYDSLHRRMIIYGGTDASLTVFYNQVWIIGL